MSDRHENSVLVALKELRGIEDDRVKKEQEAARARVEAERAAKEAAQQRARQDEESRRAAEDDRLRRIEDEKAAKIREEQLRIEEADRRARVDGEMKLQEQRMRLEIQARAGKSPVKAIVGVTVLLLAIGGVALYKVQAANQAEREEAAKKFDADRAASAAARAELEKRLTAITHDMEVKLKAARTDAERDKIRMEAQLAKREAAEEKPGKPTKRVRSGGTAANDGPKPASLKTIKKDINDDILGGL